MSAPAGGTKPPPFRFSVPATSSAVAAPTSNVPPLNVSVADGAIVPEAAIANEPDKMSRLPPCRSRIVALNAGPSSTRMPDPLITAPSGPVTFSAPLPKRLPPCQSKAAADNEPFAVIAPFDRIRLEAFNNSLAASVPPFTASVPATLEGPFSASDPLVTVTVARGPAVNPFVIDRSPPLIDKFSRVNNEPAAWVPGSTVTVSVLPATSMTTSSVPSGVRLRLQLLIFVHTPEVPVQRLMSTARSNVTPFRP